MTSRQSYQQQKGKLDTDNKGGNWLTQVYQENGRQNSECSVRAYWNRNSWKWLDELYDTDIVALQLLHCVSEKRTNFETV